MPVQMPSVDFSQWPMWLLAVLIVVNLFKEQIGTVIPSAVRDFFKSRGDRQEHSLQIEETLLNSRLQADATEQLRKSWREEQFAEMIHQKDSYLYEYLDKKVDRLAIAQERAIEVLSSVVANTRRTNDLLTTIHIALSKLADEIKNQKHNYHHGGEIR